MSIFPSLSAIGRGIFGTWLWFSREMPCHAVFLGFLASIGGSFIFAGDWALAYHSMGVGYFTNIS